MADDTPLRVKTFDDLQEQLPSRHAEAVARALNDEERFVLVAENWIAAEKDLTPISGETRVFAGAPEQETEKAWLFETGDVSEWVPKSQSILFMSATNETIETPQQSLMDTLTEDV